MLLKYFGTSIFLAIWQWCSLRFRKGYDSVALSLASIFVCLLLIFMSASFAGCTYDNGDINYNAIETMAEQTCDVAYGNDLSTDEVVYEYTRLPRKPSNAHENVSESGSIFVRLNEFPRKSIGQELDCALGGGYEELSCYISDDGAYEIYALTYSAFDFSNSWYTWQQAYTALLHYYRDNPVFCEWQNKRSWRYTLHDINNSGTPELIIAISYYSGHTIWRYIYSFDDQRIIRLCFDATGGDSSMFTMMGDIPLPYSGVARNALDADSAYYETEVLDLALQGLPFSGVGIFDAVGSGGRYTWYVMVGTSVVPYITGDFFATAEGSARDWYMGTESDVGSSYDWHNLRIGDDYVTVAEFEHVFGRRDQKNWLVFWDIVDGYIMMGERYYTPPQASRLSDMDTISFNIYYLCREIDPYVNLLPEAFIYNTRISPSLSSAIAFTIRNYTGIHIWDMWMDGDKLYVDLHSYEERRFDRGSTGSAYRSNILIRTLASFPGISSFQVLIGGVPGVETSHANFDWIAVVENGDVSFEPRGLCSVCINVG